jgi:hypothetical protein
MAKVNVRLNKKKNKKERPNQKGALQAGAGPDPSADRYQGNLVLPKA